MNRAWATVALTLALLPLFCTACRPGVRPSAPLPTPVAPAAAAPAPSLSSAPQTSTSVAEVQERYREFLFSELPRWGLGETSFSLLTKLISGYGLYPDGAEYLVAEDTQYYFFDCFPLDENAAATAVLYVHPLNLSLDQITRDFGPALVYAETSDFGCPCYTVPFDDVELQFLLRTDDVQLWGVLVREPEVGNLAEFAVRGALLASVENHQISPNLRTGPHWEAINFAATALGVPMDELRTLFPHTENWTEAYIGTAYYDTAFRDLDSGMVYLDWGDGLCGGIHIPAQLIFPASEGPVTAKELSARWNVPLRYSYYEDAGFWLTFEDLKLHLDTDLFSSVGDGDWLTLSAQ